MKNCSRLNIAHILACSENSANNAFNYNGNNGKLNNNNKNNTNSCRGVVELDKEFEQLESYDIPLSDFYIAYEETKRHKSNKPSHLVFALNKARELRRLCYEVNNNIYRPRKSIAFIIKKPKIREVMAGDFCDRVVQTLLVQRILPYLEQYESPYSFSCRKGKGTLCACKRISELIYEVSEGYKSDCWLCSIDLKNFFMSIDAKMWSERLCQFVDERYQYRDKEIVKQLIRIIYINRPQGNCIRKSHHALWKMLPVYKSLFNAPPFIGLPIGNVTSQTMANFVTTPYLQEVEKAGLKFAFYTDDLIVITKEKAELLKSLQWLKQFTRQELHIDIHPDKFYLQHYSKGINSLGCRFRFQSMQPSKRIVHNIFRRVEYIERKSQDARNLYLMQDKVVSHINSYLGMLGNMNAYRIRCWVSDMIGKTDWIKVLYFTECKKANVRPKCNHLHYYVVRNKIRYSQLKN